MKRIELAIDEAKAQIRRADKLYNLEIWKVVVASAAAGAGLLAATIALLNYLHHF
jgi:hypothetical protein